MTGKTALRKVLRMLRPRRSIDDLLLIHRRATHPIASAAIRPFEATWRLPARVQIIHDVSDAAQVWHSILIKDNVKMVLKLKDQTHEIKRIDRKVFNQP